jgi:hypothetical protein
MTHCDCALLDWIAYAAAQRWDGVEKIVGSEEYYNSEKYFNRSYQIW